MSLQNRNDSEKASRRFVPKEQQKQTRHQKHEQDQKQQINVEKHAKLRETLVNEEKESEKIKDKDDNGSIANLEEQSLYLACNNVNSSESWIMIVNDVERRSFAGCRSNPFSKKELESWWDLLTKEDGDIKWKRPLLHNGRPLPRKAAWLVSNECKCCYRYGSTEWPPIAFPSWFGKLQREY